MEMENKEGTQDSEKPVSTSATVVSKVQNGGVARYARGQCDLTLHKVFSFKKMRRCIIGELKPQNLASHKLMTKMWLSTRRKKPN